MRIQKVHQNMPQEVGPGKRVLVAVPEASTQSLPLKPGKLMGIRTAKTTDDVHKRREDCIPGTKCTR